MNDWQPTATMATLKRRAQLMADVRHFFVQRNVLEVETPTLSYAAPTAPYLDSFACKYFPPSGPTKTCYLQTSPEFSMKKLLASGSGDIFQIARVFRNGEKGRHHSPEFTMLEWYRTQLNYIESMQETAELLQTAAALPKPVLYSYRDIFQQYLNLNPHQAQQAELRTFALAQIEGLSADWQLDRDQWLEILMTRYIEPKLAGLNKPVIIYDFPASQAQLARIRLDDDQQAVAARFEVYAGGLELANGYDECTDANELRTRFELDNQQRQAQGKNIMPIDDDLLVAIEHGLSCCTGIALGLDRLLMLINRQTDIRQVQAFSLG